MASIGEYKQTYTIIMHSTPVPILRHEARKVVHITSENIGRFNLIKRRLEVQKKLMICVDLNMAQRGVKTKIYRDLSWDFLLNKYD